jgi:hypothetical protein
LAGTPTSRATSPICKAVSDMGKPPFPQCKAHYKTFQLLEGMDDAKIQNIFLTFSVVVYAIPSDSLLTF